MNAVDWTALARLRAAFLDGRAAAADYWRSDSDLASYDATYAQRIGWKWDYVLAELARRGWTPPPGPVLDWGCGSGIAHRAYLDHCGTAGVSQLVLWDRSARAMGFAAHRARARFAPLNIATGPCDAPAVLLVSHVLTELNGEQLAALTGLAARATSVLWVEPGTHQCSRCLIAVREQLRGAFHVIAPCTHAASCGMLAAGNQAHWCHHFAAPPAAVFTDPDWGRFARETGIDLRSLPVSFLVLDRRPAPAPPAGAVRVIGRPRVYKAHAQALVCDAAGVREVRLGRRAFPERFRELKKGLWDPLPQWRIEGGEVVAAGPRS